MNIEDLLSRFAVALGVGLLIGLERGWHAREAESGARHSWAGKYRRMVARDGRWPPSTFSTS